MIDITPGGKLTIEIKATPTGAAARKTLIRVCSKDPDVVKRHRRIKAKRPLWQTKRRGGRFWHHQMKSRPMVSLDAGNRFTVLASLDAARDLESVRTWVTVSAC